MAGVPFDIQIRLGINVDDETALRAKVLQEWDDGTVTSNADERAIVLVLSRVLNSTHFRETLADAGLSIEEGEVRNLGDNIQGLIPGEGVDLPPNRL